MNHLGLFAKFWQPGTVKTRLAASIGEESACELYRVFVFHLVKRLRNLADQRTVVFSPPDRESEFRKSILPDWNLCRQSPGDLGARMQSFFRKQFEFAAKLNIGNNSPACKIVIIGADCPQIDPQRIQSAFDMLDKAPVVIGPSTDGGYYLIGMKQECPDIFANIEWSTATVFSKTVELLNDRRVEFQTLPPLTDVDDLSDLVALKSYLESREICESDFRVSGSSTLDQQDLNLLQVIRATTSGLIE